MFRFSVVTDSICQCSKKQSLPVWYPAELAMPERVLPINASDDCNRLLLPNSHPRLWNATAHPPTIGANWRRTNHSYLLITHIATNKPCLLPGCPGRARHRVEMSEPLSVCIVSLQLLLCKLSFERYEKWKFDHLLSAANIGLRLWRCASTMLIDLLGGHRMSWTCATWCRRTRTVIAKLSGSNERIE